jgi:predicted amidohydrolase
MKICAAQMRIEHLAVERNMARAKEFVKQAAAEGCDLLAFPELFLTGPLRGHPELAQPIPGPFTAVFSELAQKEGLERLSKIGAEVVCSPLVREDGTD